MRLGMYGKNLTCISACLLAHSHNGAEGQLASYGLVRASAIVWLARKSMLAGMLQLPSSRVWEV